MPQIEEVLKYSQLAENLSQFLESNDQQIRAQLSNADWLHIYANSINSYDLNMQAVMRHSVQAVQNQDQHLQDLQKVLGGNATWQIAADYAQFLSGLYDAGYKAVNENPSPNFLQDYQQMSDYIVRQMEIVDGEDLLRSQSLFEMIKHTKQNIA